MPTIYLSPSTQEYNLYVGDTQSEEYYMNLVADAMIPYLDASGINYVRNNKDMTAASSIRQSNEGNYDLHLALHSNAGAGQFSGTAQGVEVYYYPYSEQSRRAAEIIANNMRLIYFNPQNVRTVATTSLGEVARTRAPAVLIEYAFHDNTEDAAWIRNNINLIARYTVLALTEYFGIPFVEPTPVRYGTVVTPSGAGLNLRSAPDTYSSVLLSIPNGATVAVYGELEEWYTVNYNGVEGYVAKQYIALP